MSGFPAALVAIIPSLGVALIFWFVMRAVIRADRRERAELARIDAEDAAKAAAEAAQQAHVEPESRPSA